MSRLKEMDRSLKVKSITDKLQTSGVSLDKILDSLKRGNLAKRKAGLKSGGRAGLKHGGSAGPVISGKKVGIQIK